MVIRAALAALLLATPAAAKQVWAEKIRITGIAAIGDNQIDAAYRDTIWVGLSDESWLPATCRDAGGLVFRAQHGGLLQIALAAFERGDAVTLKADDAVKIGDYCQLYQLARYAAQ
jgi:hypothetical protein